MRQKTLMALAVVTVAVTLVALLLPAPGGTRPKSADTGPVFPALKDWIGTSVKMTVTGPTGTVTVTRPAPPANDKSAALPTDGWSLADKGGYPVPASVIRPIMGGLVALHAVAAKTDRPALYARLDLADPGKGSKAEEIALFDGNGARILSLVVGKRRDDPLGGSGDGLYIRKPDDKRSWLAQPAFAVPDEPLGWVDRKILDIDGARIKEIVLTPTGGKPLDLIADKSGDKLAVKDLPKNARLKSDNPGSDVASGFRYLELADVEPAARLTAPPVETVHLGTFDGETVDLTLARQDNAMWVTVTAAGKDADQIVQRTKGWAYRLDDAQAKTFQTTLADLLQPPGTPATTLAPLPTGSVPDDTP